MMVDREKMIAPTTSAPRIKIFRDEPGAAGGAAGAGAGAGGAAGAGAGAGGQPWFSTLPEDIRGEQSFSKYETLEAFARGHLAQSKLIGKPADKLIELPGVEDDQGRLSVLRKLGAPEAIDGYKLTAPEGAIEGLTPEGPLAQTFLASAHKVGLLPAQAQAIYQDFVGTLSKNVADSETSDQAARAEGVTKLKAEWGEAFDQNLGAARFAIEKLGGDELKDAFDRHGLGDDPAFAKAFAKVGKLLAEDNTGGTAGAGTTTFNQVMAPAEARARGEELMRQALGSKDISEQRRLNQEAAKYMKLAYPEG